MKIDLSTSLVDFNGDGLRGTMSAVEASAVFAKYIPKLPAQDQAAALAEMDALRAPLTLREVLIGTASAGLQGCTPEDLAKIFLIVARLPDNGEADLESADIVLLKKAIGKHYISPVLLGQAYLLLEGKAPFGAAAGAQT